MIAVLETWLDHVARGLSSFLFICLARDCFAGWLGRIILPQVCFHFFSFVLHMIALLDALAGSFCQRFPFMSVHVSRTWCIAGWLGWIVLPRVSLISRHWSPRWLLRWMPWQEYLAKGLLSLLFIGLPDDCFAGSLA